MWYKSEDRVYNWLNGYGTVKKVNGMGTRMCIKFDNQHGTSYDNTDSKYIRRADLYTAEELKKWSGEMWRRVTGHVKVEHEEEVEEWQARETM